MLVLRLIPRPRCMLCCTVNVHDLLVIVDSQEMRDDVIGVGYDFYRIMARFFDLQPDLETRGIRTVQLHNYLSTV